MGSRGRAPGRPPIWVVRANVRARPFDLARKLARFTHVGEMYRLVRGQLRKPTFSLTFR